MGRIPDTRYARASDGVYLAYRELGDGPIDMVTVFDWMGNVDVLLDSEPNTVAILGAFTAFTRFIAYDRRGTGLSSRNVPPPDLETAASDTIAVLDAVEIVQPVLFGFHAGGAVCALLAATEPDRVRSLVWMNPTARATWALDYPWGVGPEYVERFERAILDHWGTAEYGAAFNAVEQIPAGTGGHGHVATDPDDMAGMLSRHTATPDVALELQRNWYATDVRAVLPSVNVPTLLISHGLDHTQAEYIQSLMPNADLVTFTSERDRPEPKDAVAFAEPMREWLGVPRPVDDTDSILATVLFTDIVGSTEHQASIGDHAWKETVLRHHSAVREELARFRGVEVDTAGDGFYATFDGPARAVRCALSIANAVQPLGLQIRAGLHTGECQLVEGKPGGIAVSIGARVAAHAKASEVLVSQTVKDLVAGSGLVFEDAGEHELKGVPDRWHLYRVVS